MAYINVYDNGGGIRKVAVLDNVRNIIGTTTDGGQTGANLTAELAALGMAVAPAQHRLRLLDPCDNLTGWVNATSTATGATSIATSAGPNGENCIAIDCTSTGTRKIEKTIAIASADFREGRFAMWVNSPDWGKVGRIAKFIFESGGGYYQRFALPWHADIVQWTSGGSDRIDGEWRLIQWSGEEMSAAGGAQAFTSGTTDFNLIRFGIQDGLDGGRLLLGPMYYGVKCKKAKFRFSFDDSNATDYTTAMPMLRQYGYVATSFTIAALVDAYAYSMTRNQLLQLAQNGWKIGVHGAYSHVDTHQDNYTAILADVKSNMDYVNELGVGMANTYSYPEGDYTPNSILALRALGFTEAWSLWATSAPHLFGVNKLTKGRSGTSGKTLAALQAEVDACITIGGELNFFSHQVAAGASGIHTDKSIFAGLVEYISRKAESGLCDVVL